jgi:hypothetical protein
MKHLYVAPVFKPGIGQWSQTSFVQAFKGLDKYKRVFLHEHPGINRGNI